MCRLQDETFRETLRVTSLMNKILDKLDAADELAREVETLQDSELSGSLRRALANYRDDTQ